MDSSSSVFRIGVSMGDPCGIGPEVILRALQRSYELRITNCERTRDGDRGKQQAQDGKPPRVEFVVFGTRRILERVAEAFRLDAPPLAPLASPADPLPRGAVGVVEAGAASADLALRGEVTAEGGDASVAYVRAAIRAAMNRQIAAVVTAPIHKEAIHAAGHPWPGHTELLAADTGANRSVMMMVGGGIRASLVTTHVAIAELPGRVTEEAVWETIRITRDDLRRYFGIAAPRLAVCGLNPHAGEGGRFGQEERVSIAPAIDRARREGMDCTGPVPADVVFHQARAGRFDAVVAMFHDQANIPVKLLAFDSGVNVTLGLPIIRTSPDHGTAYDIVRAGRANPGSMLAALRMALEMAVRRNDELRTANCE